MKKRIRIVTQETDDSNILYWISLTGTERLIELEKVRQEVNKRFYGDRQEFQRVYRITERA